MKAALHQTALKSLQEISRVGPSIARDLAGLGIRSVRDLKHQQPKKLYRRLCRQQGGPVDRCVLYVFRCAVYYASARRHDPERLKWWNWKDRKS